MNEISMKNNKILRYKYNCCTFWQVLNTTLRCWCVNFWHLFITVDEFSDSDESHFSADASLKRTKVRYFYLLFALYHFHGKCMEINCMVSNIFEIESWINFQGSTKMVPTTCI